MISDSFISFSFHFHSLRRVALQQKLIFNGSTGKNLNYDLKSNNKRFLNLNCRTLFSKLYLQWFESKGEGNI